MKTVLSRAVGGPETLVVEEIADPVARKGEHRVNMLVSRHRAGEINAVAAQEMFRYSDNRLFLAMKFRL